MSNPLLIRSTHWSLLLAGLAFIAACGGDGNHEPAPPPIFEYPLEVQASDPGGNPVAAVPVYLDGNIVGYTGADGKFSATLAEVPGTQVEVGIGEISGYRIAGEPSTTSSLRVTESLQGELRGIPVSFLPTLQSVRNEYLLWVQISCDEFLDDKHCTGLPILVNGKPESYTDHLGKAYFAIEGVPGDTVMVSFKTPTFDSSDENSVMVEPRNPSFSLDLTHDATIFRLQQEFTDPAARRAAAEQQRRPARRVVRPRRTKTQTPTPAPSKPATPEPPKRGPIELF